MRDWFCWVGDIQCLIVKLCCEELQDSGIHK